VDQYVGINRRRHSLWPHRLAGQPARALGAPRCQRRSRSQTRSIARRHSCEQKRCSGDRDWRTNPS